MRCLSRKFEQRRKMGARTINDAAWKVDGVSRGVETQAVNRYSPKYDASYALIIGINNYVHAPKLTFAVNDAHSVQQAIASDLCFPKENIILLTDAGATRAAILQAFLEYSNDCPADSRILLFFAGHGDSVEGHRAPVGYLIPVDGNPADKSTLIRWDELSRNADLIPAKHILFIMDACYSGLAITRGAGVGQQRFVSQMLARFSRQVVTAGKADEQVADGGGPSGQNSIFTGYLIEGIQGKAADSNGVLTANGLMHYVYQKVGNDGRSRQTPHYGHLDGDGDMILKLPADEMVVRPDNDTLVTTLFEVPEAEIKPLVTVVKPVFAEKNGYSDIDSSAFGKNEWSGKLGSVTRRGDGVQEIVRPRSWLSLVSLPLSHEPLNLDIGQAAKTIPKVKPQSERAEDQFPIPYKALTTMRSVIFMNPEHTEERDREQCWSRYLRVEKDGAIEYCDAKHVFWYWKKAQLAAGIPYFFFVQVVGLTWCYLHALKRIYESIGYRGAVEFSFNLIGTKDTLLGQFASGRNAEGKAWKDPFGMDGLMGGSIQNWKCHDENLQLNFQFVLGNLNDVETRRIIDAIAEGLTLAYNHQSSPRCFNYGSREFPWNELELTAN